MSFALSYNLDYGKNCERMLDNIGKCFPGN